MIEIIAYSICALNSRYNDVMHCNYTLAQKEGVETYSNSLCECMKSHRPQHLALQHFPFHQVSPLDGVHSYCSH